MDIYLYKATQKQIYMFLYFYIHIYRHRDQNDSDVFHAIFRDEDHYRKTSLSIHTIIEPACTHMHIQT